MSGQVFVRAVVALGWGVAVTGAMAQAASAPASSASAVPAPLPLAHAQTSALVDGLLKSWYAPAARRFATDGDVLVEKAQAWCASAAKNPTPATKDPALDAARQAWVQAMASWTTQWNGSSREVSANASAARK